MLARNDTPSTVCLSALTRAAADPCACARSLAKTLYFNGSVTALDLGKARLEDAAGAYLARALRATASRLVTLDLDDNALGPRTCSAFAETLPHATRLKSLGLQGNDLTQRGRYPHQFAAFCAALGASSLARLDLWRCLLDAPAGAALALGVRESQLLVQVELGGNDVALDDRRLVDAWLARNRETADESRRTELRAEDEGRERSAAERDARDSRQKEADVDAFIERRRCERKDDRETQAREAKEKEDEERSQRAYKEKYRLDALAKAQNDKHTKASKKKKKK